MRKAFVVLLVGLLAASQALHGANLVVEHQDTLLFDEAEYTRAKEHWEFRIGAYVETDCALVGTVSGIYARLSPKADWKKLLDCRPRGDTWWADFDIVKQTSVLYYPTQFWKTAGTDSFLVWDEYMIAPYSMSIGDDQVRIKYLDSYDEAIGKVYVHNVSASNGKLLAGKVTPGNEMIISILPADMSGCRDVYKCPMSLSDSLGRLGMSTHDTYPVFNPVDSTIWIAFFAYDYIYVVDMHGQLLDSIAVEADDFRLPRPPKSRMKSKAVARQWQSSFTRVESFTYTPPGYFLLQYRVGWEKLAVDSLPLYSTIAWAADRMPVELDVETHRQVAGVMPDGLVIFGEYLVENEKGVGLVLTEARIEP